MEYRCLLASKWERKCVSGRNSLSVGMLLQVCPKVMTNTSLHSNSLCTKRNQPNKAKCFWCVRSWATDKLSARTSWGFVNCRLFSMYTQRESSWSRCVCWLLIAILCISFSELSVEVLVPQLLMGGIFMDMEVAHLQPASCSLKVESYWNTCLPAHTPCTVMSHRNVGLQSSGC